MSKYERRLREARARRHPYMEHNPARRAVTLEDGTEREYRTWRCCSCHRWGQWAKGWVQFGMLECAEFVVCSPECVERGPQPPQAGVVLAWDRP